MVLNMPVYINYVLKTWIAVMAICRKRLYSSNRNILLFLQKFKYILSKFKPAISLPDVSFSSFFFYKISNARFIHFQPTLCG